MNTYGDAIKCRSQHNIKTSHWAIGKYKSVRIHERCAVDGMYGEQWALREADLSDYPEIRKKQLREIRAAK